jgi:hypothetical protein
MQEMGTFDTAYLDIKEDAGTVASEDNINQIRREAMKLLQYGYLDRVPDESLISPSHSNANTAAAPSQKKNSFSRTRSRIFDGNVLRNKSSFGALTFSRARDQRESLPHYHPTQPSYANIPPMILSPTSPSTPARIRPLPPLPSLAPQSSLLPNRLGEVILDPDRVENQKVDAQGELSPPPYTYYAASVFHRMLV